MPHAALATTSAPTAWCSRSRPARRKPSRPPTPPAIRFSGPALQAIKSLQGQLSQAMEEINRLKSQLGSALEQRDKLRNLRDGSIQEFQDELNRIRLEHQSQLADAKDRAANQVYETMSAENCRMKKEIVGLKDEVTFQNDLVARLRGELIDIVAHNYVLAGELRACGKNPVLQRVPRQCPPSTKNPQPTSPSKPTPKPRRRRRA